MVPFFFYDASIEDYTFGASHPLNPERLRRTQFLLRELGQWNPIACGAASDADLLRVHSAAYVETVAALSEGLCTDAGVRRASGFDSPDNPPFLGMNEASRAYAGATCAAARVVASGKQLAFSIGGGLHHALCERASGFCIFNDPAIACSILLERFQRIAYVDIDVHHGDGVQWLLYRQPRVLTCSIHQDGRTLFPGTGGLEENGVAFTSLNVPLAPGTSAEVWLHAFREAILPALDLYQPNALVIQLGTDAHALDPLARIDCDQEHWLQAVRDLKALDLPVVALGGGGYNLTTVPRMWASAVLTLSSIAYDDALPASVRSKWGMDTFSDRKSYGCTDAGLDEARSAIEYIRSHHHKHLCPA